MNAQILPPLLLEDITDTLIDVLRDPRGLGNRPHEVRMNNVATRFVQQEGRGRSVEDTIPVFLEAAWNLCRQGILRPGSYTENFGQYGDLGHYVITSYGATWLAERDNPAYVPTDANRLTTLLTRRRDLFGRVYVMRANDAVRCYSSHAYYACCSMIGAAAESILMAVGITKLGEPDAIRLYRGNSGRKALTNAVLSNCPEHVAREFRLHADLIGLWRDMASHAHNAPIGETEAFTNMRGLIKFGHFAEDRWPQLTAPPAPPQAAAGNP